MQQNRLLGGENPHLGGRQRHTRWLTPPHLVEALGSFDLDPCGAPGHDLADRTYLLERGEDGLALPWSGRVWLNPPYGKEAEPFMQRLIDHGDGIALIFARTETRMFQELCWQQATAMLFLKGRIRFLTPDGTQANAPAGAPSVLVAYGERNADALQRSGLAGGFVREHRFSPVSS